MEREAGGNAERAARRPAVTGTERASRILDEHYILRDRCLKCLPVHRTAEEVDGQDRLRALGDPGGDILRVEVHGRRVDIREDGRRSAPGDCFRRRVERERRTDDLVPSADTKRVEDKYERVGAIGHADRVVDSEIVGRLPLECSDVRPENELAALEHPVDRLADPRQERGVLSFYVNERDRTHDRKV